MSTESHNEKYNIICLSNQLWDFPNRTNKRLVMSRLAKQGHNVVFVDPPITLGFMLLRRFLRGDQSVLDFFLRFKKDKESGANILTPFYFFPALYKLAEFYSKYINKSSKKKFDPNRKTVLWIYHVQLKGLRSYIKNIGYDVLVYDCVDDYEHFPLREDPLSTVVGQEELKEQERYLTSKSDVVFATTPILVEKLQGYTEMQVHFVPNAGEYERFKDVKKLRDQIPEDLKEIPRPRIGYIGAMDPYKFDYDLIKKVAKDHPSYSFVLIGSMGIKDSEGGMKKYGLDKFENIYVMGSRDGSIKHLYMAGFDVDIIPYVLNDYTISGCFPIKFLDSLAAGTPVVVTDMPIYALYRDVAYISKTYEDFSHNIEKALKENSPDKIEARQKVAKANSWDGKVAKMLDLINEVSDVSPSDRRTQKS